MIYPLNITSNNNHDFYYRYPKNIAHAIQRFLDYDLDALYVATNAPGRSAYNRVERRMAPLSHNLSGLVLKHDVYGNHLDSKGKTIDDELEKRNFANAGMFNHIGA